MQDNYQNIKQHRASQNRNYFVSIILLIICFALLASMSQFLPANKDISRDQRHSLSDTSKQLLQQVSGSISFTSFVGNDVDTRRKIRDIINKYQAINSSVSLEFIDPAQRPDLSRLHGIRNVGETLIELENTNASGLAKRQEVLRTISEASISNAIQRLSRAQERFILFLEGHGERNPFSQANHDYSQFARELQNKGFVIERFNLAQGIAIPSNAKLIVIASPQLNYTASEVEQLQQYILQGGNLLWLIEPEQLMGLDDLLISLGLESEAGTLIDPGTQSMNIADASYTLISEYASHPALKDFNYVTLFPQARALKQIPMDTIWNTSPFLISSERVWLEKETLQSSVQFDETDITGPHSIGFSLERELINTQENGQNKLSQQRIIVMGDGDFISNRFLLNAANTPLALNLMDWLTGEEAYLNLSFKETSDTQLNLSEQQFAWLGLIFLILLPFFCFLVAARLWWKIKKA